MRTDTLAIYPASPFIHKVHRRKPAIGWEADTLRPAKRMTLRFAKLDIWAEVLSHFLAGLVLFIGRSIGFGATINAELIFRREREMATFIGACCDKS